MHEGKWGEAQKPIDFRRRYSSSCPVFLRLLERQNLKRRERKKKNELNDCGRIAAERERKKERKRKYFRDPMEKERGKLQLPEKCIKITQGTNFHQTFNNLRKVCIEKKKNPKIRDFLSWHCVWQEDDSL